MGKARVRLGWGGASIGASLAGQVNAPTSRGRNSKGREAKETKDLSVTFLEGAGGKLGAPCVPMPLLMVAP